MAFYVCLQCVLAVLGSQGIVVKCTAAIFFYTVDSLYSYLALIFLSVSVVLQNTLLFSKEHRKSDTI